MCSRGSVIPLWIDQIRNGNPITLTEPTMTRFIMSLEEAVDLVLFAFEHGKMEIFLFRKLRPVRFRHRQRQFVNCLAERKKILK